MSIGRTLANICTLGLWSFTDPDIEEFWQETKGNIKIRYTKQASNLVDKIFSENRGLKKPKNITEYGGVSQIDIEVTDYKVSDRFVDWMEANRQLATEHMSVVVNTPFFKQFIHKKKNGLSLNMEEPTTLCKECGLVLAFGPRLSKRVCAKDKSKGFFVKPIKTKEHEYTFAEMNRWGLRVHNYDDFVSEYEDDEDDYTDD